MSRVTSWKDSRTQKTLDALSLSEVPTLGEFGAAGLAALCDKAFECGIYAMRYQREVGDGPRGRGHLMSSVWYPHQAQEFLRARFRDAPVYTGDRSGFGHEAKAGFTFWDVEDGIAFRDRYDPSARVLPRSTPLTEWYREIAQAWAEWEGYPQRRLAADLRRLRAGATLSEPASTLLSSIAPKGTIFDTGAGSVGYGVPWSEQTSGALRELQDKGFVTVRMVHPDMPTWRRTLGLSTQEYGNAVRVTPAPGVDAGLGA